MEDIEANSMENQTKESDDVLAEDKFHLNLPKNVDQYTGLKMDEVCIVMPLVVCMYAIPMSHPSITVCMYVYRSLSTCMC